MTPVDAFEHATVCDVCGRESCEDHLPPDPDATPRQHPPLRFRAALDVIYDPPPVAIVEGIAWADCVSVLAAESGAGKTFVLIDLAAAVSAGLSWYGRDTTAGAVAYLTFEADARSLRLRAARDIRGYRLDDLYDLRASDPLSPIITRDTGERPSIGELDITAQLGALAADLAARGRPPLRLIVVDTVRASLAGSEDSSEAVSYYLRAIKRIVATVPGAAAILAHHAGWQDGETKRKRERGSSAWRGNGDATLYLEAGEYDRERGEKPLTLTALKVRDGETPPPLRLTLRRVELAILDRHGRPLTSCVVERDRRSQEDVEAERVAAVEADDRALDLRVLAAMRDYPDSARSRDTIRAIVEVAAPKVQAALARILRAGWALQPERQRQPYRVTAAGLAVLSSTTTTDYDRVRPADPSRTDTDYDRPPSLKGGRSRSRPESESGESESESGGRLEVPPRV
jgi:hypothetical protein